MPTIGAVSACRARVTVALATWFVVLLAGCSSPGGPSVATSAGPTPIVASLCAHELEGCTVAPGVYSSLPFEPEFHFAVDAGWTNDRAWPDGGAVSRGPAIVNWLTGVTSGHLGEEVVATFQPTTEDIAAFLRSNAGFQVVEAPAIEIGGRAASSIDVTTGQTRAGGLFLMAQDNYNLGPGQKARFFFVEGDGPVVVFIVESIEEAEFDDVLADGLAILATVSWR